MPTKTKINTTVLGNPIDIFIYRLLGADYKVAFWDEEKVYKMTASSTYATALAGMDGALKEGKMTLG